MFSATQAVGLIPKTYVLSPENADADLQVTWLTPTHLRIGPKPPVEPDLAVIRFANVDVTFVPGDFLSQLLSCTH